MGLIAVCCFAATCFTSHGLFAQPFKSAQTASLNMASVPQPPITLANTSASNPLVTKFSQLPAESSDVAVAKPLQLEPTPAESAPLDSLPYSTPMESTTPEPLQVSGRTVACQAACCWPLAKLLDQRARTVLSQAEDRRQREQTAARLQANFLQHQASAQRDVAAATALRAYYSWIANQQLLQLMEEGLQFQSQQVQIQEALILKGVGIPDPTALDRKRLELEDNKVQLVHAQRQLTAGLLKLTCCHTDLSRCATESMEIQPQTPDCGALLTYALQHRHDYLALVQLYQCLDEETAAAVAKLLTPLVGVGFDILDLNLIERLSLRHHGEELLAQIRRELKLASDVVRARIEQSVCDKCQALDTAYQRVTIAEQFIRSWETRIAALKRLEELGDARGEAMATAKAELLNARSTLVTRQLSAKLAEVDLAEAVGELSVRCCNQQAWLVRTQ